MRKYNFILMAFALLLGMAQCKKEPATPNGDNNGGVRITLKVNDGESGEKLNVYPATGAVIFTEGDVIYVGNNGKYVGTLTFENGLFQGTINDDLCSNNDYLHFYFVGNKPTTPSTLAADTTTYTVNISDQSTGLPAISYAPSKEKYSSTTTAYTAKLLNKSALVKFAPTLPTNHPITISGLNNEVEIDFANHTLTPTGTTGSITLYSESTTEKWAILLEQTSLSGLTVSASGFEATIDGTTLPSAITNNMYYNTGVGISMTATIPEGAIDGKFTVAAGKQVYFSKGNLQYIGSAATPYWKFADNQWTYLGTTTGQNSSDSNKDRDLFGFGTSGYDNGQTCWQPYSTGSGYYSSNLTGNADWGYNAISNGGNMENFGWRTLTKDEWYYVFNIRNASTVNNVANARFAKATVNNVTGVIFFPDNYTHPDGVSAPSSINEGNAAFSANNYSGEAWMAMENNGAVFLPTAGYRNGTSYFFNNLGDYWAASYDSNNKAYSMQFTPTGVLINSFELQLGLAVRLVYNAD